MMNAAGRGVKCRNGRMKTRGGYRRKNGQDKDPW
jgi:hypothetical protein